MAKDNNRIKYALYFEGWKYVNGNRQMLSTNARKIIPNEFILNMMGSIFCPVCFTNLSKSPKEKNTFSNGRRACFIHLPSYSDIECDLRTPKSEGMLYLTEELAKQAISDGKLAIIDSFRSSPPEHLDGKSDPYDQSAIEDTAGTISEMPISRHNGERFRLPSIISTVNGICRKFDENLLKYYIFPGEKIAKRLVESLTNIVDIKDIDNVPKLYYGEISNSYNAGNIPKPTNLRMTRLICNTEVKDFYLKAVDSEQSEKGINDNTKGRIILFWGEISWNGIGLCVSRPKWGEYALLPEKYNNLLKI